RLLDVVELDVELAARDQLARDHERPRAVLPHRAPGEIAAVARERGHEDAGHLVARLVLAVVERLLLAVDDPVRRRGLVALQRELRRLLVVGLVVDVAAARLRVALAAGVRRLHRVVRGVVEVLVVDLADRRGATDELRVPDVRALTGREVLVAVRLALAGVAGGHAASLLEGRRADVPDDRELVLVIEVVVAALVGRIGELLPRAVRLLHPRAALHALRLVLVLIHEVETVGRVDGAHRHFGRAAGQVLAADHLHGRRGRAFPRGVHGAVERRRRGHLLRDQVARLRARRRGGRAERDARGDQEYRHGHRPGGLHQVAPFADSSASQPGDFVSITARMLAASHRRGPSDEK